MDDEFQDLQRLLSIKRHEAPPPDYFEDFLWEFQRRQRAEMLKRPLWRLALDRFEGALPNFSLARTMYAGASAMAMAATVVVSTRIVTTPATATAPTVAVSKSHADKPATGITLAKSTFDFNMPRRSFRLPETNFDRVRPTTASLDLSVRPRYVLDTQPVSYAQSSTF